MKRIILLLAILCSVPAFAQTAAIQGFCDLGGAQAKTSGLNSTNYQQGIIPSCTVTVYLTGTATKATIYADGNSAPLSNPFTASAVGSVAPGQWLFWTAINQGYDVVMSGGIAPNTYPQPVTLTDVFPSTQFVSPGTCDDCLLTDPVGTQNTTALTLTNKNLCLQDGTNCPFSSAGSLINPQCFLGGGGLTGAFTDGSGNVIQPLCIGNGPTGYTVPAGATQLQVGINDSHLSDNSGSFIVSVTYGGATSEMTISGTTQPWISATNPSYAYGDNTGTPPVIAETGLTAQNTITIQWVSGSVNWGEGFIAPNGNGLVSKMTGSGSFGGGGFYPTKYMSAAAIIGASSPVSSVFGRTGSVVAQTGDYTVSQITGAQPAITLTTTGTSGASTLTGNTLNIPQYSGGSSFITSLTTTGTSGPSTVTSGVLNIPQYSAGAAGVSSINSTTGAFTFTGAGVSCTATTCTFSGGGGSSVTWPTSGDLVKSNGTNTPDGIAPVDGECVVGAGGAWTAGSCAGTGGGISGLTAGFIPLAGSPTTLTANSHINDGVTTPGTLTATEPLAVNASGANSYTATEGTTATGIAGSDVLWADATAHHWMMNNNNGTSEAVVGASDFASPSAFGVVKCGTNVTCTSGVISVANGGFNPYGGLAPSPPPLSSTLTWVNQNTATASDTNGLTIHYSSSANYSLLSAPLPATPYTFTVMATNGSGAAGSICGIGINDGTTKIVTLTSAGPNLIAFQKYTTTAFVSSYATTTVGAATSPVFLRITDNGSTFTASYSYDGTNFIQVGSPEPRTDYLSTPTNIGLIAGSSVSNIFACFDSYWSF